MRWLTMGPGADPLARLAELRDAASRDPTGPRAQLALGQALFLNQRFHEAAQTLEHALRLDSRSVAAGLALAYALRSTLQWDRLLTVLDGLIEIEPGLVEAHELRGEVLAEKHWSGPTMAPVAIDAYQEAVRLCREQVARNPRDADLRHCLGRLLTALGDTQAGLAELREAVRLRPRDPELLFGLGEALEQTDEDEALRYFAQAADCQRALALANPDHAPHHARLGDMLSAACQEGDWLAWYDAALVDPELRSLHDALCCDQDGEIEVAFMQAARQLSAADWSGALAAFQKVLDERPVHAGALCGLGMAASQLGLATAAAKAFEQASTLWPTWERPRRALAALSSPRLTPPKNTS